MTPEGRIKKKLATMLKQFSPEEVWSFPPQAGPFGSAGIPDRLACVAGRFLGIEVKSGPGKHPTALQEQCMKKIEAAGGYCYVVYDGETIAEVEGFIINILTQRRLGVK
jgi:hypothetical protein